MSDLNWSALVLVGLGAVLLVIAWQGTHRKVWAALTGQQTSSPSTNTTTSSSTTTTVSQGTLAAICQQFPALPQCGSTPVTIGGIYGHKPI